jgi:hypothetical protein
MLLLPAGRLLAADSSSPLNFVVPEQGQERCKLVEEAGSNAIRPAIKVNGESIATMTTIAEVDHPPVDSHQYVVRGRVRHNHVSGVAYLEMWNHFGAHGSAFSRTLGTTGTMKSISGDSNWREFELPFFAEPGMRPVRLTINVVMPGEGTIVVGPLTIHSLDSKTAWWTDQQGGLVGGIGGSLLGLIGTAIGVLSQSRRAKLFVVTLVATGLSAGIVSLIAGIVALCLRQPYGVWYPPLLLGVIATAVLGGLSPKILRRYREEEFRRMAALDA